MSRFVVETPRKAMTPARRRRILGQHGWTCAREGCEVSVYLEIDHVVPVWMGGAEEDENLEPLCDPHHKEKTARDAAARAKVKRLHKAGNGGHEKVEKKGPRLKSRGFDTGRSAKIPSRPFNPQPRSFR